MNNDSSYKTEEDNLTPQENHLSKEREKKTAKRVKRSIFQNQSPFFRWARRVFIFASLGIAFWLAYPAIFALIKKRLPEGYSTLALILAIGIIALIVFSVWALWSIPKWQVAHIKKLKETSLLNVEGKPTQSLDAPTPDERFSLENEARKTLAQIIGGMFVLLGLFFTAENVRITQENATKTQRLADRGQVTERFTKAIAQLGDKQTEVRLGGIYALEKIAEDYPNDYHWTVMDILTAFVRENAPNKKVSPSSKPNVSQESSTRNQALSSKAVGENSENETRPKPATDIQAILTVLGKGSRMIYVGQDRWIDLSNTNLSRTKLYSAKLNGADLSRADLSGAFLAAASLVAANLSGADLSRAFLIEASLNFAHLREASLAAASLVAANLSGADLSGANLVGADLSGANLVGADLSGADLSNCRDLVWEQIDSAYINENTKLPPQFEMQKQETLKRLREGEQKAQEGSKQP